MTSSVQDDAAARPSRDASAREPASPQYTRTLTLEVDTRCNLACSNCFALADLPGFGPMDPELARAAAREARELGFSRLHITGGEPMLWKPLFDFLSYGHELGFRDLHMNTNASYLDQENCRRLADLGESLRLSISLNGFADTHDAVRGAGTHAETLRGLEQALRDGIRVEIFTTVDGPLLNRLPEFVADLFEHHPMVERLILIQNHRIAGDTPDQGLISPERFIDLVRAAMFLGLRGYPLGFLDHSLVNVVARRLSGGTNAFLPLSPNIRRPGHISISRHGHMTSAHSDRLARGSYEPGALGRLLESPEYAEAVAPDPACADCPHLRACRAVWNIRPSPAAFYDDVADQHYCRRVLDALNRLEPE